MDTSRLQQRDRLANFPIWLALAYFGVSAVYIRVSDRLAELVVHDPERLTRVQSYKGWAFVTVTAVLLYLVVRGFARSVTVAEESLAAARLDYRRLVETITDGVCVSDPSGRVVFVNDRLCEMLGVSRERALRDGIDDILGVKPPIRAGSDVYPADEVRIARSDGDVRWAILSEAPLGAPGGAAPGRLRVLTDNTSRRRAADEMARLLSLHQVLISELDHRVRNNLASLVAIIEVTSRGHPEVERFAGKVIGRVRVMAAAYALLSESRWQPVSLTRLVTVITAPAEERRNVVGPPVEIPADQVVPLMLVLHELFTNARDHGSLRAPDGRLEVRWRVQDGPDGPRIALDWTERGGPPPASPAHDGFGLAMATGIASSDLRGRLDYAASPAGVEVRLTISPTDPPASGHAATGRTNHNGRNTNSGAPHSPAGRP